MNILCLGAGFTGRYLWRHFSDRHRVIFLSRRHRELIEDGLPVLGGSDWLPAVSEAPIDAILDTVPAIPMPGSQSSIQDPPYLAQAEQALRIHPSAVYLHISSTSVYPASLEVENEVGAAPRLDENAPVGPQSPRGRRRLLLERRLAGLYPRLRILRSTGIYGPGRCLALRFQKGDFRRAEEGNRVVSRIHVHDLCRLILAAAQGAALGNGRPLPQVVHAVDERPAPNREAFEFLERLLNVRIPGNWRQEAPRGRAIVSLYAKEMLGGAYRYPSYREGFPDCLAV